VHAVTPGMLGPSAVQLGVGLSEVPVVPAGRLKASPVELLINVKLLMIVLDWTMTMVVVGEKRVHWTPE
jgi:hypothetical protein